MSFYEGQQWQNASRQPSWEQPLPPSRSGASSTVPSDDSIAAFSSQFDEVERAVDNLVKSGKMFGMPPRRDSLPTIGMGRGGFSEYGMPPRHHSVSEFDPSRSQAGSSSSLQSFYANQRYQSRPGSGPPNDPDNMVHAKRRMAAQRERELRNYHQEQQYNRTIMTDISNTKADGALSPNSALSEDERRDLVARQHHALYSTPPSASSSGPMGQEGFDPFGLYPNGSNGGFENDLGPLSKSDHGVIPGSGLGSGQRRSRANSTSSPASNPTSGTAGGNGNFSLFDGNQGQQQQQQPHQPSHTSTSSPGASPTAQGHGKGIGPIGSRFTGPGVIASGTSSGGNTKRSGTPLPSPLSYGFGPGDGQERSASVGSAAQTGAAAGQQSGTGQTQGQENVGLGWGKSGVWGKNLGMQASVWG